MNAWKIGLPLVGAAAVIALIANWNKDEEEIAAEEILPKQQISQPAQEDDRSEQPIIIQQPSNSNVIGDMATGAMIGHMLSGSGRNSATREVHHYNAVTNPTPKAKAKPAVSKPTPRPAPKVSSWKRPAPVRPYRPSFRSSYGRGR